MLKNNESVEHINKHKISCGPQGAPLIYTARGHPWEDAHTATERMSVPVWELHCACIFLHSFCFGGDFLKTCTQTISWQRETEKSCSTRAEERAQGEKRKRERERELWKLTFLDSLKGIAPVHKLHWDGDLLRLQDLVVEVEVGHGKTEHLVILFGRLIEDGSYGKPKTWGHCYIMKSRKHEIINWLKCKKTSHKMALVLKMLKQAWLSTVACNIDEEIRRLR